MKNPTEQNPRRNSQKLAMSDIFEKFDHFGKTRAEIIAAAGINPFDIRIDAINSPSEAVINGRKCVILGSNNYLGLTFDPAVIEHACEALRDFGTGTTGSRAASGSYAIHQKLERQVAGFFGCKHAMLFTTGYQANLGMLSCIAGKDDIILIDADSHASIYDGCKMSDATVLHYKHNDPADLARRLKRLPTGQNKLVVTEGIFSMLGDRAPLAELVKVAKQYGAWVMVDEAHSFGVLGETGRGLVEETGLEAEVDFIVGTFSKSAGAIGGFCVSNHDGLNSLRLASRPYLFTASLPPSVVASVSATIERISEEPRLIKNLWSNSTHLYHGLAALGFVLGPDISPIIAVWMPDFETGLRSWKCLLDQGVYVNIAAFVAVPGGGCLLRCSVCATHSKSELDQVLEAFSVVAKQFPDDLKATSSASA